MWKRVTHKKKNYTNKVVENMFRFIYNITQTYPVDSLNGILLSNDVMDPNLKTICHFHLNKEERT